MFEYYICIDMSYLKRKTNNIYSISIQYNKNLFQMFLKIELKHKTLTFFMN